MPNIANVYLFILIFIVTKSLIDLHSIASKCERTVARCGAMQFWFLPRFSKIFHAFKINVFQYVSVIEYIHDREKFCVIKFTQHVRTFVYYTNRRFYTAYHNFLFLYPAVLYPYLKYV